MHEIRVSSHSTVISCYVERDDARTHSVTRSRESHAISKVIRQFIPAMNVGQRIDKHISTDNSSGMYSWCGTQTPILFRIVCTSVCPLQFPLLYSKRLHRIANSFRTELHVTCHPYSTVLRGTRLSVKLFKSLSTSHNMSRRIWPS
jgi:hypothetical protein